MAYLDNDGGSAAMARVAHFELGEEYRDNSGATGLDASRSAAPLQDGHDDEPASAQGSEYQRLPSLLRTAVAALYGGDPLIGSAPGARPTTPIPPRAVARPLARRVPKTLEDFGSSEATIAAAALRARKIANKDIPLLLEGETGTGKEMFARAFHNSGPRSAGPFVAVNCASIPEGLIESELFGYQDGAFTGASRKGLVGKIAQADGGTLFLDEIGDMPLNLQARLLRVIQEREVVPLGATRPVAVDIRLVTATHRRLRNEVDRGSFREDLYYRINGLRITLPPLRQRTDIGELVATLVAEESDGRDIQVSDQVLNLLHTYHWPGNVRQMRSVIRTALAFVDEGDRLEVEHLPEDIIEEVGPVSGFSLATPTMQVVAGNGQSNGTGETRAPLTLVANNRFTRPEPTACAAMKLKLAEIELAAIHGTLDECHGNVSEAARCLGISRNTLYRKLGRL